MTQPQTAHTATKQRAERNRTLTLLPGEAETLRRRLTSVEQLAVLDDVSNRTIHANLMEALPHIPEGCADLILIDPPYNLTKDFHGIAFNARSEEAYKDYLESWLPQVVAKLKPKGSLYLCGDWRSSSTQQQVLARHLTILNRITWQREKGRGAAANWKNGMEDIWFAVKDPKAYYFNLEAVKQRRRVIAPYRENGQPKDWTESEEGNYRLTCPSNFWDDISVPFWSMPENTDHPTQKPEKLIAKLILASSREGDLVLDPFLGSGTTSVVAKKLNRCYCGIELNEEYCLWAEKRLLLAEKDTRIQGYSDGVFWERNSAASQQAHMEKPMDLRSSARQLKLFKA